MESSFQIGHCFYETLMNQKQGCNCGKGKIEVNIGMLMIWLYYSGDGKKRKV
jgi:hypothetical protein